MKYKVTLNGKVYEVEVEKGEAIIEKEYEAAAATPVVVAAPVAATPVAAPAPVQAPAKAVEPQQTSAGNGRVVKSQLPGAIVAVKVDAGSNVNKGDVIVVIEAMKMENDVVAPISGKLANVFVKKGDNISTGAQLFEIV